MYRPISLEAGTRDLFIEAFESSGNMLRALLLKENWVATAEILINEFLNVSCQFPYYLLDILPGMLASTVLSTQTLPAENVLQSSSSISSMLE